MVPTTSALICVLLLFWLEETVHSQRGHCAGKTCHAIFQEPRDFQGARSRCKDPGGELFVYSSASEVILNSIVGGISGQYWLEVHGTSERAEEAGLKNCSSISVVMGRKLEVLLEPCQKKLDGFLCQFPFDEPCGELPTGGGAQVTYSTYMGFKVKDSETFPPGTIAVAEKVGSTRPDSKYVCYFSGWLKAPWTCEVMMGGCDHSCNSTTRTCICPAGQSLNSNNITCTKDPDTECEHECQKEGGKDDWLERDGRSLVAVDECTEENPCTGENEECEDTHEGFRCMCKDGFHEDQGVCIDVTICSKCEHKCENYRGVYQCKCMPGYRVSATNPTKCEQHCTERACVAKCITNDKKMQCSCPLGYILDMVNGTAYCADINECENKRQCDHTCSNSLGSYRCSCNPGYELYKEHKCVEQEEGGDDASGSTSLYPTPDSAQPAVVHSYIKTGSVLGIAVFVVLLAVLLCFLVRYMLKRCGKFQLSSFKHHDIDIFYLQQVTTETYKRLSFD
ncbi:thrombomodulin-like [Labrus mixtus]|uniref:thrombomodulin-like n=1 Tax=Labrus mixtus TaxID=508554 RepID=UPI0029C0E100|nr:thrombomodulin-like [Labrus mixtus]